MRPQIEPLTKMSVFFTLRLWAFALNVIGL
jgi:hypothetical protein